MEYLNTDGNWKGKEYDENGNLIYEGEYLKGDRHGKGILYGKNWEVDFIGDFFKGKKVEVILWSEC